MKYKVTIRKELAEVKPEVKQIDGKVYDFRYGWKIEKTDSSIYAGEDAMIPMDVNYPVDAPTWIASGDLSNDSSI